MAGMMATSARPSRRSSAHCEGTVNERSYLSLRAPWVKPYTNGAVFRYCTTEMRSFLKMAAARDRFSIAVKIYDAPMLFCCKTFGTAGGFENEEICPRRTAHSDLANGRNRRG